MDANVGMSSVVDYCHVGPTVPDCQQDHKDLQRASLLHSFLCEFPLCLVNTFADAEGDDVYTRTNWSGVGSSQYDFIASSLRIPCVDAEVDRSLNFTTDHQLVYGIFELELPQEEVGSRVAAIRNWKPAGTWDLASQELAWQWQSWEETCDIWRSSAQEHVVKRARQQDGRLQELLSERSLATSVLEVRRLNKLIWRRRRQLRRQGAKHQVDKVFSQGVAPSQAPKYVSVNWHKLFQGKDPKDALHERCARLYSLTKSELDPGIHLYICIHVYTNIWYACIHVYVHIWYICMWVFMYLCIYVFMYICIYVRI